MQYLEIDQLVIGKKYHCKLYNGQHALLVCVRGGVFEDKDGGLYSVFGDVRYVMEMSLLEVINDVHSQHADDLCWMDIDRIFIAAGLPVPDRSVGDKKAMLKNCDRFVNGMCKGGGGWKSYAELEQEIKILKKWKREASLLLQQYDAIADLIGGPLGSSKPVELEKWVRNKLGDGNEKVTP